MKVLAVVFDLLDPLRAAWHDAPGGRKAGLDKTERPDQLDRHQLALAHLLENFVGQCHYI